VTNLPHTGRIDQGPIEISLYLMPESIPEKSDARLPLPTQYSEEPEKVGQFLFAAVGCIDCSDNKAVHSCYL
jgi:hypothetical protein